MTFSLDFQFGVDVDLCYDHCYTRLTVDKVLSELPSAQLDISTVYVSWAQTGNLPNLEFVLAQA